MLVVREETPSDFLDEIRQLETQNSKDSAGVPTLCMAIRKFRSAYLVEELIKDGAEVNAFSCLNRSTRMYIWRNNYRRWGNFSAIHLAASLGRHEIVRSLVGHGADVKSKTTKGIEVLDFVLDPFLRCEVDDVKITESDDLELLKLMKENGLDLNKKDGYSRSVLHRAMLQNCPKIASYLISVGCDVNSVDRLGYTPLHNCNWKSLECARLLLENNANPNAQDDLGNTVYHHILRESRYIDRPNPVKSLDLLHKFQVDPNIQNITGKTALHEYIISKKYEVNIEVVDFMLQNGADPNITDIFERTPVHYLVMLLRCQEPHVFDIVWTLLTKVVLFGTNLNCRDITGIPLFHVLVDCCFLYPECFDAKLWIGILRPQYKIDVNVQDFHNSTVLHLVSAKGEWQLAEMLLRHGGNMNILDCDGNTPLDVAILHKQWDYARKLLIWPSIFKNSNNISNYISSKNNSRHNHDDISSSSNDSIVSDINNCSNINEGCDNSNNNNNISTNEGSSNNKNNIDNNNSNDNINSSNSNNNIHNNSYRLNNSPNDDDNCNISSQFLYGNKDKKLQRSTSMTLFKPREKHGIVSLGACINWTKYKLDTIAQFLAQHGNEFNSSGKKPRFHFWESDLSPVPRIPEAFLTQLSKSSLLHLCEENSLEFHIFERCEEEHCLVAQQVFSLVTDLLKKCSEIDPRMSSELHWTGSSSEGTKMWFPDEFDFLMELVDLRDCCYIKDKLALLGEVILNTNKGSLWSNLCSGLDLCILSPTKLKSYLSVILWKAAFELDKKRYPNIHFNLCRYNRDPNCFLNDTKVGINLTVCWKGEVYKNLKVSIDVTPGVPVAISEEQMSDLHESARKELSDRCIHVIPYTWQKTGWRASFSLIEVRIVRNLTKRQISLYKCLKLFRDILIEKDFKRIPSYHLKTFLLGTLFHDPDEEYLQLIERECFCFSACLVLLRLKQIAECREEERSIQHFFHNYPLHLSDYDLRWCRSVLDHLESNCL